ncbi:MAG: hypothetical protein ABIS11_03150 [Candidatus Dojkabacteria bacterium]
MKLYIPIEHVPFISVPGIGVPKEMSVLPVAGRSFVMFKDGILRLELQSNVFFVATRSIVLEFPLAVIFWGVYPTFAVRSIICSSPEIIGAPLLAEDVTGLFEKAIIKNTITIKLIKAIPIFFIVDF